MVLWMLEEGLYLHLTFMFLFTFTIKKLESGGIDFFVEKAMENLAEGKGFK